MSVKGRKASRYTQGSQSDSTAPPKSLLLCVATGIKAPKVSSIPSAAGHSLCRRPAVGIKQSSTFSGTPYPLRIMRVSISESDRASGRPWPPLAPAFLAQSPAACSSSCLMFSAQRRHRPPPPPFCKVSFFPVTALIAPPREKSLAYQLRPPQAGLQLPWESVLRLLPHRDAQALGSPLPNLDVS